jgi:hypothetical protein
LSNKRVDGFLQHTLFVADDDVRRAQFDQALQAVVPVDDAAIQIVQIRGRKTTAIQGNQRAQFRRQNRDDIQNHPFRASAGGNKRLDQFQALNEFLTLGSQKSSRADPLRT